MFLEQTWKLLETCNSSLKKDCESLCINSDKEGDVISSTFIITAYNLLQIVEFWKVQ